jgi:uncharacterized protein (TIGR03118 family)
MRRAIRDLQSHVRTRSRDHRRHQRRPAVEGLEVRSLLSAGGHMAGHAHVDAKPAARAHKGYEQTNLVSDLPGSQVTDSNLINPWGVAFNPKGTLWVSDEGTGVSTLYTLGQPAAKQTLTVTIPLAGSSSPNGFNGPTGQVFNSTNSTTDFLIPGPGGTSVSAVFIFDTLQGTIEAWNPKSSGGMTSAEIVPNGSSAAEYTGLALGSSGGQNYLYAVNDNPTNPGIQVYNGSFSAVTLTGTFVDPKLPKGDLPYNIVNINGDLFVTYRGANFTGGAVAEFNTDGTFIKQIASNKSHGKLQAPWGVALAPADFGKFSNDLLVGNFANGRISAYKGKRFAGQLKTTAKQPIAISGLWSLAFGNGTANGGPTNTLFFTAGIDGETHGLLGSLQAVTT